MLVDLVICLLFIGALIRGSNIGFVKQFFSAFGFLGGLFIGSAVIEPHIVGFAHTQLSRSLLTLISTLGTALLLLTAGEHVGAMLKNRIHIHKINIVDTTLGVIAGGLMLVIIIWLVAPVLLSLPLPRLQNDIRSSFIVSKIDTKLPKAPNVVADLGRMIDPNGFPQVFSGLEPNPNVNTSLPNPGAIQAATIKDRASVVKIEGRGCGGIVEGSGFIAGKGVVITNAHVVAGVTYPYIIDDNGSHRANVIWFDSNLDLAVLTAINLPEKPLNISIVYIAPGTQGAVLGYPGGGDFSAGPAVVVEEFNAIGHNIYNQGSTQRDIYDIRTNIMPGNSGGPLVDESGSVIGVVFAESTTYNHVGYALATKAVVNELHQAEASNSTVSTGTCAD